MKPTLIKISISQDGLLPQQSIELGETLLQSFPKKLMSALDFEKVDKSEKKTTFVGITPVFVVIGEKTQEVEIELTVSHPELRDKVVDIFTAKPPAKLPADNLKTEKPKPKPAPKAKPAKKSAAPPVPKAKAKPPAKPAKKSAVKPAPKKKVSKGRTKK